MLGFSVNKQITIKVKYVNQVLYTINMVYKIPHLCDCEDGTIAVFLHHKNKQTQNFYYHGKNS